MLTVVKRRNDAVDESTWAIRSPCQKTPAKTKRSRDQHDILSRTGSHTPMMCRGNNEYSF